MKLQPQRNVNKKQLRVSHLIIYLATSLLFFSFYSGTALANGVKKISNSVNGGDCAAIGTWNAATKTCTLTTDITTSDSNGIEIISDGITLDGAGHSVTGSGSFTSGGAFSVKTGVTIKNLTVSGFTYGIYVLASSNSTLTGNTLTNNTYGVYIASSNGLKVYNNNFINNINQAVVSGGSGNVFNVTGSGGNYWSNFDTPAEGCSDNNNDLFCDTAYAFTGGQDNQPYTSQDGWNTMHVKPNLVLLLPAPFWASYADYQARELSVTWTVVNKGPSNALNATITSSNNSYGVTLITVLPVLLGDIPVSGSTNITLKYRLPAGVTSWISSMTASAQDAAGATYTYP